MSVLDQVAQMHRDRQAAAETEYQKLVVAIADDEPRTAEETDAVLTSANRTISDLYSDTASRRHRNQLRATVANADALAAKKPKWDTEIEQIKAVRQAAEDAYTEAVRPLHAKLREYQEAQLAKATSLADLRSSAPDWIKTERKRLNAAAQAANAEWRAARENLEAVQNSFGVRQSVGGWEKVGDPNRSAPTDPELRRAKLDTAKARWTDATEAQSKIIDKQQELEQQAMEA